MPNNSVGNQESVIVVPTGMVAGTRYVFTWWKSTATTGITAQGSQFPFGWKNFTVQLCVGNMTAGSIEIDVTTEIKTAIGTNANWEPIPAQNAASGFSFYNPLSLAAGQRLLHISSGPWVAFSALVSNDFVGSTAYILAGCTS